MNPTLLPMNPALSPMNLNLLNNLQNLTRLLSDPTIQALTSYFSLSVFSSNLLIFVNNQCFCRFQPKFTTS